MFALTSWRRTGPPVGSSTRRSAPADGRTRLIAPPETCRGRRARCLCSDGVGLRHGLASLAARRHGRRPRLRTATDGRFAEQRGSESRDRFGGRIRPSRKAEVRRSSLPIVRVPDAGVRSRGPDVAEVQPSIRFVDAPRALLRRADLRMSKPAGHRLRYAVARLNMGTARHQVAPATTPVLPFSARYLGSGHGAYPLRHVRSDPQARRDRRPSGGRADAGPPAHHRRGRGRRGAAAARSGHRP